MGSSPIETEFLKNFFQNSKKIITKTNFYDIISMGMAAGRFIENYRNMLA